MARRISGGVGNRRHWEHGAGFHEYRDVSSIRSNLDRSSAGSRLAGPEVKPLTRWQCEFTTAWFTGWAAISAGKVRIRTEISSQIHRVLLAVSFRLGKIAPDIVFRTLPYQATHMAIRGGCRSILAIYTDALVASFTEQ